MEAGPTRPNEENVRFACEQFDKENGLTEQALDILFMQYRRNDNHSHVLLKVVALNRLYSTSIFAVHDVAKHIYDHSEGIDSALIAGAGVVDQIAKVVISSTGKVRSNYSFASKYCSWHNQSAYPIWDGRVCRCLASLKGTRFVKPDRWARYAEFVALTSAFREYYRLDSFGFKQIDKFL
jgi:hypothetical protein